MIETGFTSAAPTWSPRFDRLTAPAVAGVVFVAAWVTGLAAWPSNLDVAASGQKVLAAYAGHEGVAVAQYLLVEGVAAVALAVVATALGRAAIRHGEGWSGWVVLLAGIGAVVVSLLECALGLLLSAGAVPDGQTGLAGELFQLLNRLDGVKMLALAAMALAAANLARAGTVVPRWLGWMSAGLGGSMIASAVGYLLLNSTLAQAAAASLVLLLSWVCATGTLVGHGSR
jgi:hypothetical protein